MIDLDLVDDLLNDNVTKHNPRAFIMISDDEWPVASVMFILVL
jgi:hypothetical protein